MGQDFDVARAALLALADLAPKPTQRAESLVVPLDWFRWLDHGLDIFGSDISRTVGADVVSSAIPIDRSFADRLAAIQQVRASTPIRIGWLFVAGTVETVDANGSSRTRRVLHPLVTRRVVVSRPPGQPLGITKMLSAAGDVELSPLIDTDTVRREFARGPEFGGGAIGDLRNLSPALLQRLTKLRQFAISAAAAAGLRTGEFELGTPAPEELIHRDGLRIVVGLAVYCTEDADAPTRSNSLRGWAEHRGDRRTAFDRIYGDADDADEVDTEDTECDPSDEIVDTTMPLSSAQSHAVRVARRAGLSVLTGAPGTGKSHTISAIVSDALRRGDRVLVTAKTDAAVDALIDLLERQPGPAPVVFGSNERREALARRLAGGQLLPSSAADLHDAGRRLAAAVEQRDRLRSGLAASLGAEVTRSGGGATLDDLRRTMPGVLAPGVDHRALERRLEPAEGHGAWWRARRLERTRRAMCRELGTDPGTTVHSLRQGIALAQQSSELPDGDLAGLRYERLEDAERQVRTLLGGWLSLDARSPARLDRRGLMAVAALATALRSGRDARRTQLDRLDEHELTHALPLWIGTLGDVDDLLPATSSLFDLVVVDEASSVEQVLAAPALLRARRAIISGDPRQLRHVSFVSDATVDAVLAAHGLADLAAGARLDVRRNSLFDAAASAAPVCLLDEHHRSDPHLIDVVARRLYPGELTIATRSRVTEDHDCIDVVRTDGARDGSNVVTSEIDAIVREVQRLLVAGERSVGIISPFRAQTDAIEARVLQLFDVDSLERLDLRIGTVHGMQGNERDIVLCSLALGPLDAGAARFVDDPHLLAVLLTRARRRQVMFSSYEPLPGTVLADYLAGADSPPGTPAPVGHLQAWQLDVLGELRRCGFDVAPSYPVGRHVVEGATRVGDRAVGIVCGVHPDGVDAHLERHLALLRRQWLIIEVLRSDWEARPAELVLDVVEAIRNGSPTSSGGTMPA